MSNRTPAKSKLVQPAAGQQNALSEKAEFANKALLQAVQMHLNFFLKGASDLMELMQIIENQLINYCQTVGRVDDLLVYYNDQESGDSSEEESKYEKDPGGEGMNYN